MSTSDATTVAVIMLPRGLSGPEPKKLQGQDRRAGKLCGAHSLQAGSSRSVAEVSSFDLPTTPKQ